MYPYDLLLLAHLLLFAYWLGGDLGVFYTSGYVVDASLPVATRQTAARIMLHLDLVPRICMALMLTSGGLLGHVSGVDHPPLQLAGIIALGPVWLTLVLVIHFRQGTDSAVFLGRVDLAFRCLLIAAMLASVSYAWLSGRLDGQLWLALKLVLFAALIGLGVGIRILIRPFVAALARLADGTDTRAIDQQMRTSLARVKPLVLLIWAGLLASAVLGIVQPG